MSRKTFFIIFLILIFSSLMGLIYFLKIEPNTFDSKYPLKITNSDSSMQLTVSDKNDIDNLLLSYDDVFQRDGIKSVEIVTTPEENLMMWNSWDTPSGTVVYSGVSADQRGDVLVIQLHLNYVALTNAQWDSNMISREIAADIIAGLELQKHNNEHISLGDISDIAKDKVNSIATENFFSVRSK